MSADTKAYLGDGVYVRMESYGDMVLTTEEGYGLATNTIVLEPGVWRALLRYVDELLRRRAAEKVTP